MVTLDDTLMPIPYAQVSNFVILVYLFLLPFSIVGNLEYMTLPLCFMANLTYLTIAYCAAEMELPFGNDPVDVDVRKLVRRIDKHTASLTALWLGKACPNFDLNPDASQLWKTEINQEVAASPLHAAVSQKFSRSACGDHGKQAAIVDTESTALIKDQISQASS